MKHILTIVLSIIGLNLYGQTNTFPSSGDVGIGTTSPESNIHISSVNSGDAILRIEADEDNNNENDNPYIEFRQDGDNTRAEIGYLNNNFFGIANQGSLSGTTRPTIRFGIDLSGNVGIGTTAPEAKLHVYNSSYLGNTVGSNLLLSRLEGRTGNYFNISTWLLRDADGSNWLTSRYHNGISVDASYLTPGVNTRTWWERDPYNNIQSWGNSNATYFTINNGKIGIGTINPTEKLVVDGKILAEEVKVQNVPTSDYVFEPDYDLRPIKEVEAFVKAYGHLPDIPSAEEFKENGVGLGEMDNMLLMKVEELTLYVIEQNKTNEALAKTLIDLKKENEKLDVRLKKMEGESEKKSEL